MYPVTKILAAATAALASLSVFTSCVTTPAVNQQSSLRPPAQASSSDRAPRAGAAPAADEPSAATTQPGSPDRRARGRGMGMGGGTGMRRDGPTVHSLLADHEKVRRSVEEISNGIRSVTTSDDPEVAALIRKHVWQMKDRVERGQPIRMMDPLFREIFVRHDKIHMEIEDVPGGVRVTETSDDPQVVLLIRQHAKAVDEFVESGMRRMRQPTPLPEGYSR